MRSERKLLLTMFLTAMLVSFPPARAAEPDPPPQVPEPIVEPPFVSEQDGKRVGAFVDVAGRRASLHLDLPDGTTAYLSIPSQLQFALGSFYVLEPTDPPADKRWPRAAGEKDRWGVQLEGVDRPTYLVFDLGGGTLRDIGTQEPFAAFFEPHSGYFNPFLCALLKGVPFRNLIRDDVALLRPYRDGMDNLVFDLVPAIDVGYASLVVASVQEDGDYYPVRVDAELLKGILATYRAAGPRSETLPFEVFRHALRFETDLSDPPLGLLSDDILKQGKDLSRSVRALTSDLGPGLDRLEAKFRARKKEEYDLNEMAVQEMRKALPETLAAAKGEFADALWSQVVAISARPGDGTDAAALSALWKDDAAGALREKMTEKLLENIDYWWLEMKSGDRFQGDLFIAAILAAHDPAGFGVLSSPARFVAEPAEALAPRLEKFLAQESTEDDPLYARDYYAMGLVAKMAGRHDASEKLMKRATLKCKEELGELVQRPATLSEQYRALVWGKLVGAWKNPQRYAAAMADYKRSLDRYKTCLRRKHKILLERHNLANFAQQSVHTKLYTEAVRSGLLNCGKRPRPPRNRPPDDDRPDRDRKPDDEDKPEREDIRKVKDAIRDFKGGVKRVGKIFKPKAPTTPSFTNYLKSKMPKGPFDVPQKVFEAQLEQNLDTWGRALDALEADPPRADFRTYEEPAEPSLPAEITCDECYDQDGQELLKSVRSVSSTLEAAVVTFDRIGGAKQAGDSEWEYNQTIHLESLKAEAGYGFQDVADRLQDRAGNLQGLDQEDPEMDPEFRAYLESITDEDYTAIGEFCDGIRSLGDVLASSY